MPSIAGLALWFAAALVFFWIALVFFWIALNFGGWLAWGLCLGCLGVALWFASGAAAARAARRVDQVRAALLTGEAAALVIASRARISVGSVYAIMAALERSGDVVSHIPEQSEVPGLPPLRRFALTRVGKMRAGNNPVPLRLGRH